MKRKELMKAYPLLESDALSMNEKIVLMTGIVLYLVQALEEQLTMAAAIKNFPKEKRQELESDPNKYEKEVNRTFDDLLPLGLTQLASKVKSIEEFKDIKTILFEYGERRNFIAHFFAKEISLSLGIDDNDVKWRVIEHLASMAEGFNSISENVKDRYNEFESRHGIVSVPPDAEKQEAKKIDDLKVFLDSDDLFLAWAKSLPDEILSKRYTNAKRLLAERSAE